MVVNPGKQAEAKAEHSHKIILNVGSPPGVLEETVQYYSCQKTTIREAGFPKSGDSLIIANIKTEWIREKILPMEVPIHQFPA